MPRTRKQYDDAVNLLDNLIDEVGEDETHPLASLMEVLGVLIEKYEDEHVPELAAI
jgi:HTH-type transcriptional regulator/antitoxin HigA